MYRWLTRSTRPYRRPQQHQTRPRIEALETRDCPAPVVAQLAVVYGSGRNVTIQGMVRDDNPGTCTVSLDGVVSGTAQVAADGTFSLAAVASGLGNVTATVTDAQQLTAQTTCTVSSAPPSVLSFTATHGLGDAWTFSGRIADESVATAAVTLSGCTQLQNASITVNADGTFSVVINIPSSQNVLATALATDCWGLQSNETSAPVI